MSAVDVTKPIEGEATTASVRQNFVVIKAELETAEAHYAAVNPHGTTAAQVGLANVENKSSAAIRSEITASDIATPAHAANAKATPVDADEITGLDSAASFGLIRVTWANIKATLKTYFDTLYAPAAPAVPTTAQVQAIFATSDLGALYDVGDIATLYQDNAGATRVTSLDQGVRRVDDMSGKNAPALYVSGTLPKYTRICNQLVATESFDHVAWVRVGAAPTVTPNAALNPFGVMTADQLAFSAAGSGNRLQQGNAGNYQRNTVSVYLKGTVGGERIVIWNGWSDTLLCVLTTSWQRFTLPETALVGSTGLYIYAQSGTPTIYAFGVMVNQGTTAAPYQSVSATGVYDAAFWPPAVSMATASLTTTFSSSLGSACTVAWARPRFGAEIRTAQTIGTSYVDSSSYAAKLIINRALTAPETALVTAWLNQKAGI